MSMSPGRWRPARVVICPRKASWDTRPCFSSTYRSRSKVSWSALSRKPRGSENPRGGWAPSSDSKAAREVDCRACWAGAKAVAEATRARAATDFIMVGRKGENLLETERLSSEDDPHGRGAG